MINACYIKRTSLVRLITLDREGDSHKHKFVNFFSTVIALILHITVKLCLTFIKYMKRPTNLLDFIDVIVSVHYACTHTINPLRTRRMCYIRSQPVPLCKHSPPRL
jgi:hypothetical protein